MSATVLEKGGQTVGGSSNAWDTLGRLTGSTNLLGAAELRYDGNTGRVSRTKTVTAGGDLRTDFGNQLTGTVVAQKFPVKFAGTTNEPSDVTVGGYLSSAFISPATPLPLMSNAVIEGEEGIGADL